MALSADTVVSSVYCSPLGGKLVRCVCLISVVFERKMAWDIVDTASRSINNLSG